MDAQTAIAISAIVIAIASLAVSIYQVRAMRLHNRHTVRPLLQLTLKTVPGAKSGIWLVNTGLGPAIVTGTRVWLDGEDLGPWNRATSRQARAGITPRPRASALADGMGITPGYIEYLLSLDAYDPSEHTAFRTLIEQRVELEIRYESLYGGEDYMVTTRTSWWRADLRPDPESTVSESPRQRPDVSSSGNTMPA
ncbi:hypothetical protein AB0I81_29540 [Nonomuraea sp. NPDC050404]|uniref:hypothetical protein n=1 Tax=Nonomuraea sp. NPDC050404 TaxID=3155783 RepID=UPI0033EBF4CB